MNNEIDIKPAGTQNALRSGRRIWRRKLFIVPAFLLLLLVTAVIAGVWYANFQARQQLTQQLSALNQGDVKVGDISIGSGGIRASGVVMFLPGSETPWLTIDELNVDAPLSRLAAGDLKLDRIEFKRPQINLELAADGSLPELLKQTESDPGLPADSIVISDASIKIRQPNHDNLTVTGIDVSLRENGDGIQIEGAVGGLVDSAWTFKGSYHEATQLLELSANTDTLNLDSKRIASLPMFPKEALNAIDVTGTAIANIQVKAGGDGKIEYCARVVPTDLNFASELIGIEMQIVGGTAEIADGVLTVTKLDGRMGDGTVVANSSIDFSSSPFHGTYDALVSDVSVDGFRKLAQIPETVNGVFNGSGTGSLTISNGESAFELRLKANGTVAAASYEGIPAENATVSVEINSLAFDSKMQLKTLNGEVKVNSKANQVAVQELMESFEIEPGNSSQKIDGLADAAVRLSIPLQTAGDIGSWKLDIVAEANRLAVEERFLDNVAANIGISDGFLNFEKLTGVANSRQNYAEANAGMVTATGRWPIAQERTAKFEINGKDVSIEWLLDIAKEYSKDVDAVLKMIDPKYDGENSSVAGKLSVTATIEVAPDQIQDISKWNVTGVVSSGELSIDKRSINSIESRFKLVDGVFILEQFKGAVPDGGTIELKVTYPIDQRKEAAIELSAKSFPIEWLILLGTELQPELGATLEELKLQPVDDIQQFEGLISIDVNLNRDAVAPDAADDAEPTAVWKLDSTVTSESLRIRTTELREFLAKVKLTETEILVERLQVSDLNDGVLSINGRWPLARGNVDDRVPGEFDANWLKLPLQLLADLAGLSGVNLSGTTSGELKVVVATDNSPKSEGLIVDGKFNADEVAIGGMRLDSISANVSTTDKLISLSQIQYGKSKLDANIKATVVAIAPYEFNIDATLKDFDPGSAAATEMVRSVSGNDLPKLSGSADINASLVGTLQPFGFASSGNLDVRDLTVEEFVFDDISARWKNIGADLIRSEAVVDIFGGNVSLREITADPNRISVDIERIDAEQLSSLFGESLELTGLLSGEAFLDSWEDPDHVHAELRLNGASATLGPVKVGALGGEASYEKGQLNYSINGNLLDGNVVAKGAASFPKGSWDELETNTELTLTGADLNRLARESRYFSGVRDLTGLVDANFNLKLNGPEFKPDGAGKISFRELKLRNELLIARGNASVQLSDTALVVNDLKADLAGGDINGEVRYFLDGKSPGSYQLSVRRLNLSKLGALSYDRNLNAEGYLEARIRGTIEQQLVGTAQIAMQRLSVYDIPGQSLRLPIQYRLDPATMSGKIELPRTRVRIFDGATSAKAKIEFGSRLNISLAADLTNLDSGKMISAFTSDRTYDQGKLSGKVNLSGRGVRSLRDLQGTFVGSLDRSKSLNLPVLEDLSFFLNTSRLTQTSFDSDDIRLQLANGQVKIERLTFASDVAQLMVTGTVSTDQRLHLDVIARIGNLNVNPLLKRLADSPLTTIGTPAIALLSRVTEFVSNRVVYVQIGGTVRNPTFRLQTGLILRDEALRFFIRGSEIQNILNNRQIR